MLGDESASTLKISERGWMVGFRWLWPIVIEGEKASLVAKDFSWRPSLRTFLGGQGMLLGAK